MRSKQFPSSTTWVVPAGIRSLYVFGLGGGGGGGSGAGRDSTIHGGGGGGGGGACYVALWVSCTPGETATIVIGAGGTGGAAVSEATDGNDGNPGGDTTLTVGGQTYTFKGASGGGGCQRYSSGSPIYTRGGFAITTTSEFSAVDQIDQFKYQALLVATTSQYAGYWPYLPRPGQGGWGQSTPFGGADNNEANDVSFMRGGPSTAGGGGITNFVNGGTGGQGGGGGRAESFVTGLGSPGTGGVGGTVGSPSGKTGGSAGASTYGHGGGGGGGGHGAAGGTGGAGGDGAPGLMEIVY